MNALTANVDHRTEISVRTPTYYEQSDAYRQVILELGDSGIKLLAIYIDVRRVPALIEALTAAQRQYGDQATVLETSNV